MTLGIDLSASRVATLVASTIDPVFATIDGWRDALAAELARRDEPTARELDPFVESLVRPELGRIDGLVTGAGFVADPGYLPDAPWHLAWWLGAANTFGAGAGSGVRRLDAVSDPDSEQFRDYTTLEWWRVPARTGRRHLTGPYVDYLCTDDYTVTITTPVTVGGELVGLVGTDVYVARLEQVLLPVLRGSGHPCSLVNASTRVVASTDAHRAPGSLLRLDGLADALAPLRDRPEGAPAARLAGGAAVVPCGDTSLALVLEG
ncbi:hypothetical protein ACDF64_04110 [Agromyces sp. MMS24-JH15]|uniref:PDC sensor domain-containing protein n=1 Tax=Agromyces sp. MMS24-JH15 TaxID=3243765 RepID=UPI00374834B7